MHTLEEAFFKIQSVKGAERLPKATFPRQATDHGGGIISHQAEKLHSHDSSFEGRTAETVVPELSESIVNSPPNWRNLSRIPRIPTPAR